MIKRHLAQRVKSVARKFPIVGVTGPRQSGKTTLVKSLFPGKPYASFENLDTRALAQNDPRGFLQSFPRGAVLDEVQRVPELFSYLQGFVDDKGKNGLFILTGSQHFLLMESISQSLAGRIRLFYLLPFSLSEMEGPYPPKTIEELIFKGGYPRIHHVRVPPSEWYPSYLQTYIERDVRLIKNIGDLNVFQKFIKLCAARTGQILNLSSMGNECGITHNTAKAWISILEASFIVTLLRPHHKNFNKRLVKNPKLYFYDTGLACSLLEITNTRELANHPLKGSLFETFVITELVKQRVNRGLRPNLFFWRDKTGHEIDCLCDKGADLLPIEIKAGKTINDDYFKNIRFWKKLSGQKDKKSLLIYAGDQSLKGRETEILGWRDIPSLKI